MPHKLSCALAPQVRYRQFRYFRRVLRWVLSADVPLLEQESGMYLPYLRLMSEG